MSLKVLTATAALATSDGSWLTSLAGKLVFSASDDANTARYSTAGTVTNGVNANGVMLILRCATAPGAETITVDLEENTGSWVQVATSGALTMSNIMSAVSGAIYVPFTTPYTTTTNQFRVKVSCNTASKVYWYRGGAGDYGYGLMSDTSTARPAATDTPVLARNVALTLDETTTWAPDNLVSLLIGDGATFTWENPAAAAYVLTLGAGHIYHSTNSIVQIGTEANPITQANRAKITYSATSTSIGLFAGIVTTSYVAKIEIWGEVTTLSRYLSADANTGQNTLVFTENTPADWEVGDQLRVCCKTTTNIDTVTYSVRTTPTSNSITLGNSANSANLNLDVKASKKGSVVNITNGKASGVWIQSTATTGANLMMITHYLDYFKVNGVYLDNVAPQFTFCWYTTSTLPFFKNAIITNASGYTTMQFYLDPTPKVGCIVEDVHFVGDYNTGASSRTPSYFGAFNVVNKLTWQNNTTAFLWGFAFEVSYFSLHASGVLSITSAALSNFYNCYIVSGIQYTYGSNGCSFYNCEFRGTGFAISPSGATNGVVELYFKNCNAPERNNYFVDTATGGGFTGIFAGVTCTYSALDSWVRATNLTGTTEGSYGKFIDMNNTAGDHRTYVRNGMFKSNSGKLNAITLAGTARMRDLKAYFKFLSGTIAGTKIACSVYAQQGAAFSGFYALPYFSVNYDNGTIITDTNSNDTNRNKLENMFTVSQSNAVIIATVGFQHSADDKNVNFDSLALTARKYGYLFYEFSKTIDQYETSPVGSIPSLETNPYITEATAATVAAYTGISINHGTQIVTISAAHTLEQLYDYSQYDLTLDANMGYAEWLTSTNGETFISDYDIVVDGVTVTATAFTLDMGANVITFDNSGIWNGRISGDIEITTPDTYTLSLDANTITFTTAGTYDLRNSDIIGTIELVNTSGGAVVVQLDTGQAYTNTGPNITVDNTVSVTLSVPTLVAGSTLYIYNDTDNEVIYNDVVAGTSYSDNFDYAYDIDLIVKVRKPGYLSYETTATLTVAGATIATPQEVDTTYNASYNAGMATDWDINTTTKKLARLTENWNTIRDFHSYYEYLFSTTAYMDKDVPTFAFTKYDITFDNGYTFDAATDFKKLKTGSIAEPVADDLWGSIITIGNATTETVYLIQNDSEVTSYWSAGNIDILIKVKAAGTLINSGLVDIYCRDFNQVFDHTQLTITEGGKNFAALSVGADANNETLEATVAGYNDIVLDETGATVDITAVAIDEYDTPADYTLGVDCAERTVQEVFEYLKYATRHNSAFTINGDAGEEHYRYSTYTEVKNSPLGALIGGIFYGAQGVWLTNVDLDDALNYVLIDNAGVTHQGTPPPTPDPYITVTNIVAGSRIQVYDLTTAEELANEIVAGTSYSLQKAYTGDLSIRIRLMLYSGATAYEFWESQNTFGSTGVSFRAEQVADAAYNSNGIVGEDVTNVAINDGLLLVSVSTGTISWPQLYAYETYWLFSEEGIRDEGRFAEAVDTANYKWFDFKLKNTTSPTEPLVVTGGYGVDGDTGSGIDMIDTSGGTIFTAPDHVVAKVVTVSGENVITGDIADIPSAPTAVAIRQEIDSNSKKLKFIKNNL